MVLALLSQRFGSKLQQLAPEETDRNEPTGATVSTDWAIDTAEAERPITTTVEVDVPIRDELLKPIWEFVEDSGPEVTWLWKPFVGEGLMTLLAAATKSGKSTRIAHLLRAMLTGSTFWDWPVSRPRYAYVFTEERKSLARTLTKLGVVHATRFRTISPSERLIFIRDRR